MMWIDCPKISFNPNYWICSLMIYYVQYLEDFVIINLIKNENIVYYKLQIKSVTNYAVNGRMGWCWKWSYIEMHRKSGIRLSD